MSAPQNGSGIGEFIHSVGQAIDAHHKLPPHQKAIARAEYSAGLLVLAGYGVYFSEAMTGRTASRLVEVFMRSPSAAPRDVWVPLAIWGATVILAAAWGMSGLRGAVGSARDGMAVFWGFVRLGLMAGAMKWAATAPVDWQGWVFIHDLVIVDFMVMEAVGICLNLRGSSAERLVRQQIEEASIPWQSARRGRR